MPGSIRQLAARTAMPHNQNPAQPDLKPSLTGDRANQAVRQPRYYNKLSIVSNAKGESILFGWDNGNALLTIWLPAATAGEWIVYEPRFNGLPGVQDFDLISNHLQGRKDDTLDLAVIADSDTSEFQSLYFPALPFSTRLEDWQAYFSNPIELTPLQPGFSYAISLGLLPKARRSVFTINGLKNNGVAAIRYDVEGNGQIAEYPFDLGPEWSGFSGFHRFRPCVAARQPASFTVDDGLVGSYFAIADGYSVVKVMLPKAPLGDAWELTPLPPLVGLPHWSIVNGISSFRRADNGEPIITYVMSVTSDSPLNKAVWVMDNHTLYHSDQGCWWLAAPSDQVFPPPAWAPVRALPVQMQVGKPPTWIWLQLGNRLDPKAPLVCGVIESRSAEFFNEGASNQWLAGPADQFEASLASSPTAAGETVARVFMANNVDHYQTQSLTVATLDNASGQWQYQDVPVPPLPAGRL